MPALTVSAAQATQTADRLRTPASRSAVMIMNSQPTMATATVTNNSGRSHFARLRSRCAVCSKIAVANDGQRNRCRVDDGQNKPLLPFVNH